MPSKKVRWRLEDTRKYPAVPLVPPAHLDLCCRSRCPFPLHLPRFLRYSLFHLHVRLQIRRCFLPGSCRLHDLLPYRRHSASRQRLARRNPVFCSIRPCIQPVFPEVSYRELLKTGSTHKTCHMVFGNALPPIDCCWCLWCCNNNAPLSVFLGFQG